jgi:hypothetical protein
MALRDARGQPRWLAEWSPHHRATMASLQQRTLRGVGDPGQEVYEDGGIAWHLRRCCTPEELTVLTKRKLWPREVLR